MPYFEDMKVGDTREFGSYEFTNENIVRFAKKYDPQPFHLSEEARQELAVRRTCAPPAGTRVPPACA